MTKQALMVPSGSMRSQIVGKMVSDAKPSRVRAFAIAAITIGLGLLAIPLSGGSEAWVLARAPPWSPLKASPSGLMQSCLSRSVSEYMVKKAAGGTDPDRARALSQEDPSLGWLSVEILATSIGAGAAIKTFRSLAAARRAALQSQGPLELEKQLRELRQLGEEAGLSDSAIRRLTREARESLALEESEVLEKVRAWAKNLARSNPSKMTKKEIAEDLAAYMGRRDKVKELFAAAQSNPEFLPEGITLEHLELAVKGDPETGMRVPLNYAVRGGEIVNDPAEAAVLFANFKGEVEAVFASHGIDDAVVVQLGSGTTGWSTAPGKNSVPPKEANPAKTKDWVATPDKTKTKPWASQSDVDIAIFSDKALKQAMDLDVPINPKNQQAGKYTTLRNGRTKGRLGFYDTPLGKDLKALGERWDEKIYGQVDPDEPMFDFKLNLNSDEPFRSAVEVVGRKGQQ